MTKHITSFRKRFLSKLVWQKKSVIRNPFLDLKFWLLWIPAFAGMTTTGYADPITYQPDFCNFEVTFPAEPYISRKCDGNNERCYDQVSYTKVYELSSTVNIEVICNPIDQAVYEQYSAQVMEATLRAMTDKSVITTFDTSYRTENSYKQAGLVGEGMRGRTPTLFVAQLWIGQSSALSVKAELVGDIHHEADSLFSEILKSVKFVKPAVEKEKNEN